VAGARWRWGGACGIRRKRWWLLRGLAAEKEGNVRQIGLSDREVALMGGTPMA
jgi:hypothetical protein